MSGLTNIFRDDYESVIDRPSQWLNIGYFIATCVAAYFIPVTAGALFLVLVWKSLELYFTQWIYTDDTIVERKGVFNVTTDEIQFFRIKDVRLYRPLLYRIVGISKITLITSDKFRPTIVLNGVYNGKKKRDMFKQLAISTRRDMGVKEFDIR